MSWTYVLLVGPAELEGEPGWPERLEHASRLAASVAAELDVTLTEPERTGVRQLAGAPGEPAVAWVEYTWRLARDVEPPASSGPGAGELPGADVGDVELPAAPGWLAEELV